MTAGKQCPTMHQRESGSRGDFERDWTQALHGDATRYLIYPCERPSRQYELFELVKASHIDRILAEHQVREGKVLEFGCGSAGMSIYLANRGYCTVACDVSMAALRVAGLNAARSRSGEAGGSFTEIAGDVFHLPFGDAVFDMAMSYGLLEHFAPHVLGQVLGEVIRTLRPGGLLIADIAHGGFSVRTVGTWMNLVASLLFHVISLRWRRLRDLPAAYLDHFYENDLDDQAWAAVLRQAGLCNVHVLVCNPFPPLALSGWPERVYVRLMQRAKRMWMWFDQTQPCWGRKWGWLYLVWGAAPRHGSSV